MVEHLIKACVAVPNMKEIFLIGFFQFDDELKNFVSAAGIKYGMNIRYLQECDPMGTAGGVYRFRDEIRAGEPEAVFLINGDVCGIFNLHLMLRFHRKLPSQTLVTVMATEATRKQSLEYGEWMQVDVYLVSTWSFEQVASWRTSIVTSYCITLKNRIPL